MNTFDLFTALRFSSPELPVRVDTPAAQPDGAPVDIGATAPAPGIIVPASSAASNSPTVHPSISARLPRHRE